MIIHKTHPRERKTECNMLYDDVDLIDWFNKRKLRTHWRLITCKKCLNKRYK